MASPPPMCLDCDLLLVVESLEFGMYSECRLCECPDTCRGPYRSTSFHDPLEQDSYQLIAAPSPFPIISQEEALDVF